MRMLRLSHMGPVMETVKLTRPVSGLQLMRMLQLSHMDPVMETVKLTRPVSGLQLVLSVEGETSIPSRSDLGEIFCPSSEG